MVTILLVLVIVVIITVAKGHSYNQICSFFTIFAFYKTYSITYCVIADTQCRAGELSTLPACVTPFIKAAVCKIALLNVFILYLLTNFISENTQKQNKCDIKY